MKWLRYIALLFLPTLAFTQEDSFHGDTAEIMSAYRKAVGHMVYWQLDSALLSAGPALQRMDALMASQGQMPPDRERSLIYWHAKLLDLVGRADPEITRVDSLLQAMEVFVALDSIQDVARVHIHLSEKYGSQGLHLKSIHNQRTAVKIFEDAGKQILAANARNNLGVDYRVLGDPGAALELHLQAQPVFEAAQDTGELAYTNVLLGAVHRSTGQFELAIPFCHKALQLYLSKGDEHGASMAMFDVGHYYMRIGQLDSAEYWLKQSMVIRERFAYFHGLAYASQYLAYVKEKQDSLAKAIPYYLKAADYFEQVPTYGSMAAVYADMADTQFKLGLLKEAEASLQQALEIVQEHKENWTAPTLYNRMGSMMQNLGRKEDALEAFRKGREIALLVESYSARMRLSASLYRFHQQEGQFKEAYQFHKEYLQAKDSADSDGDQRRVTQALLRHDLEQLKLKEEAHDELERFGQRETLNTQSRQKYLLVAGGGLLFIMALGLVGRIRFSARAKRKLERQQSALRKAKERAEQSEQFKERFLANMSHEIRTPMNAIMGMTAIVRRNEHLPEQENYLNAISQSSNSLLHIINDILDLSKLNAQRLELDFTAFNLLAMVEKICQNERPKAEAKGLELRLDAAGLPEAVNGDATRVEQVLQNLVQNAVKFTESGHIILQVKALEGDRIEFRISDTGNGIPQDRVECIFDEFTKAYSEGKRKYGGSGLGLTLSKRLVELMEGNIEVQSRLSMGSTFTVVLPLAKADRSLLEEDVQNVVMKDLRILLADDNEFNRMVANDELHDAIPGVRIVEAKNGKIAFELAQAQSFDLVLMDVQMPEMNGYDATKAIRGLTEEKARTPILAMTANGVETEVQRCLDAGMDGFIPKPFTREELIGAMEKALGQRK